MKKLSKEHKKLLTDMYLSRDFEIINQSHGVAIQVRIAGLDVDVYPTTGTICKIGGKALARGYQGVELLAKLLGDKVLKKKEKFVDRVSILEKEVEELKEFVSDLQISIEEIKLKL